MGDGGGKWGSGGMERINKNNLPNTDDSLPKTKALYLTIKITAVDAVLAIAKAMSSIQILPVYFRSIAGYDWQF
jgi:hypothetical protein